MNRRLKRRFWLFKSGNVDLGRWWECECECECDTVAEGGLRSKPTEALCSKLRFNTYFLKSASVDGCAISFSYCVTLTLTPMLTPPPSLKIKEKYYVINPNHHRHYLNPPRHRCHSLDAPVIFFSHYRRTYFSGRMGVV